MAAEIRSAQFANSGVQPHRVCSSGKLVSDFSNHSIRKLNSELSQAIVALVCIDDGIGVSNECVQPVTNNACFG